MTDRALNSASHVNLFGETTCVLDRKPEGAHVSDLTGGAWLCSKHLSEYEQQRRSVGRTVFGFLRERVA